MPEYVLRRFSFPEAIISLSFSSFFFFVILAERDVNVNENM